MPPSWGFTVPRSLSTFPLTGKTLDPPIRRLKIKEPSITKIAVYSSLPSRPLLPAPSPPLSILPAPVSSPDPSTSLSIHPPLKDGTLPPASIPLLDAPSSAATPKTWVMRRRPITIEHLTPGTCVFLKQPSSILNSTCQRQYENPFFEGDFANHPSIILSVIDDPSTGFNPLFRAAIITSCQNTDLKTRLESLGAKVSSITEALNLVGAMRIATKSIPEGEDCLRFTGGQIFKGKDHAYVLFKHTFVTELESFDSLKDGRYRLTQKSLTKLLTHVTKADKETKHWEIMKRTVDGNITTIEIIIKGATKSAYFELQPPKFKTATSLLEYRARYLRLLKKAKTKIGTQFRKESESKKKNTDEVGEEPGHTKSEEAKDNKEVPLISQVNNTESTAELFLAKMAKRPAQLSSSDRMEVKKLLALKVENRQKEEVAETAEKREDVSQGLKVEKFHRTSPKMLSAITRLPKIRCPTTIRLTIGKGTFEENGSSMLSPASDEQVAHKVSPLAKSAIPMRTTVAPPGLQRTVDALMEGARKNGLPVEKKAMFKKALKQKQRKLEISLGQSTESTMPKKALERKPRKVDVSLGLEAKGALFKKSLERKPGDVEVSLGEGAKDTIYRKALEQKPRNVEVSPGQSVKSTMLKKALERKSRKVDVSLGLGAKVTISKTGLERKRRRVKVLPEQRRENIMYKEVLEQNPSKIEVQAQRARKVEDAQDFVQASLEWKNIPGYTAVDVDRFG